MTLKDFIEENALKQKRVAEIADVTGVNTETAKSRLRYALTKLRQGLTKD